ncbi:MAG TPA: NAD(P)H-hydrate dehydratase [Candidatus Polarisedimenticolia bacterium]|nr:NAD(P)H-hydrate dehydratase [Candidatus Polarisedimenticolia bacterium]
MEILTCQQMRNIDRRAVTSYGVPEIVLMENAGFQVYAFLRRTYDDLAVRRILLLCGRGNNGGDAFVLGRHLRNGGFPFETLLFGRRAEVKGSAAVNLKALERLGVEPREVRGPADWSRSRRFLADSDLVLDGILGTGLSRPVEGLLASVFEDVNKAQADVVAVDIPSGLSGDSGDVPGPCISADYTVTFARPKIAHIFPPAEALCGDLRVVDISIPPQAVAQERVDLDLLDEADLVPLVPVRRADSHKGDYGHALIVAGSRGKGGAARMVALGALRAGCGLVTAAVPSGLQSALVTRAMEAMSEGLPETEAGSLASASLPGLLRLLEGKRVVAIGPGLTTHPETKTLIRDLVRRTPLPIVLDADGVNAFAGAPELLSGRTRPLILTPHPGEMGRLLGIRTAEVQARRVEVAREFARLHRCTLILKGHRSLVATPSGRVSVSPTGNPGMATGGSGDVLTGILAGLIAQGLEADSAARLGVYLHGLAGDLAAAKVGEIPLMARDILARFPQALARLRPPGDVDRSASGPAQRNR